MLTEPCLYLARWCIQRCKQPLNFPSIPVDLDALVERDTWMDQNSELEKEKQFFLG